MIERQIPGNLRDTVAESVWYEIEAIGHSQEVDPSRGAAVVISNPSDKMRRDCEMLADGGGCSVTDRGDGILWVTLYYEEDKYVWWLPEEYRGIYKEIVEQLRGWFGLSPVGHTPGWEKGGIWRKYSLGMLGYEGLKNRDVCVNVCDLKWLKHFEFLLQVKIRWDEGTNNDVFFDDELIIKFPSGYPLSPPDFFIEKYKSVSVSHEHHVCMGKLDIPLDWREGDTIISAINAALNFIVWHYNKFGY